jgi:hypothetical protein
MICMFFATRPMLRPTQLVLCALVCGTAARSASAQDEPSAPPEPDPRRVEVLRVPRGGIQPQLARGSDGGLHLLWLEGDPAAGDLFHARSSDGATFSPPISVARRTAIAMGNIRGAQLALGSSDRVHVAWMGAALGGEAPMLTTRATSDGPFEPPLDVITARQGLDGGGSIAADATGHVYVVWHAPAEGARDEAGRAVWVAPSSDGGASFQPEQRAWSEPTGACGCCGIRALCAGERLYVLYRSATERIHRDMVALVSSDHGQSFRGSVLDPWTVEQCVMSTSALANAGERALAAWETEGQIYWASLDTEARVVGSKVPAPGSGGRRKHPALAVNLRGEVLLAWTEGLGWQLGGELAWQVFSAGGAPIEGASGRRPGVPAWSLVAAAARPDGSFLLMY